MKRMLLLMAVVLMVTSVATATDPWRIKVTDYNASAPIMTSEWVGKPVIDSTEGSWGSGGGRYRQYWWFGAAFAGSGSVGSASYQASTGAISFGPTTATSVEGWGVRGMRDTVLKVGAGSYKMWRWNGGYHGHDVVYATSTNGVDFSVTTETTIYGPTITNTGTYGLGAYLTTGGIYLCQHRNSGAAYQNAGSKGIATTGLGETEWYDIDTGQPDSILPPVYSLGDPIIEPHVAGGPMMDSSNYDNLNKACSGDLFTVQGTMQYSIPAWGLSDYSIGLNIGTAGELSSGDDYVWLADTDNANTTGVGNALLSSITLSGLSGPSLRASVSTQWWTGWPGWTIPIGKTGPNQPATSFLFVYDSFWDTDSSGSGYDVYGCGRAKLLMTRNKADLNYDGTVNFGDIGPFSGAYGSTSGLNSNYNTDADMNASGKVDAFDIGPFSGRYGTNCSY